MFGNMLGVPESWSRANVSPQSVDGSGDEVNDGASSAGTGESLDTIIAAKCSEMVDASRQRGATFVPSAEENGEKYEAMPNLGARERAFAQALAQELSKGGEIGSRDAITQKMMRELSDAEKKDYKKLGHKEKSDFRLAYAQKKAKQGCKRKRSSRAGSGSTAATGSTSPPRATGTSRAGKPRTWPRR